MKTMNKKRRRISQLPWMLGNLSIWESASFVMIMLCLPHLAISVDSVISKIRSLSSPATISTFTIQTKSAFKKQQLETQKHTWNLFKENSVEIYTCILDFKNMILITESNETEPWGWLYDSSPEHIVSWTEPDTLPSCHHLPGSPGASSFGPGYDNSYNGHHGQNHPFCTQIPGCFVDALSFSTPSITNLFIASSACKVKYTPGNQQCRTILQLKTSCAGVLHCRSLPT